MDLDHPQQAVHRSCVHGLGISTAVETCPVSGGNAAQLMPLSDSTRSVESAHSPKAFNPHPVSTSKRSSIHRLLQDRETRKGGLRPTGVPVQHGRRIHGHPATTPPGTANTKLRSFVARPVDRAPRRQKRAKSLYRLMALLSEGALQHSKRDCY